MVSEERILVVDDEIVIRELLYDILTDEGFYVETAPNGRVALDIIQEQDDFVVLFTDIMMPEMDGIELVREARKVKPSLVPIVMTGYATLETARAAVKEGAYDYVLKPFNLSEVKMAVSNALDRRRLITENTRLLEISNLFTISETIASIREESRLLDFVLQAALERVNAKRGSLMVLSEDGNHLRVACSQGVPEGFNNIEVPIEGSIAGWVAKNVQPLLVKNTEKFHFQDRLNFKHRGGSFISVPLERKAQPNGQDTFTNPDSPRVLAVLNVTERYDNGSFSEADVKILSIMANHAAAAMENVHLIHDIDDAQREIVFTLGEIVETRSKETGNHVKRVAEYCKLLGLKCGLNPFEAEIFRLAAPLHDVGKVGIPDAVLQKPGKLTPDEFDTIKTHAQIGFDMLKVSKGRILQTAAIIAKEHHERYDGLGYPNALKGGKIDIYGRICGIADVFDALGAKRVYKDAWPMDKILDYFREQKGKQFDPDLIDVFFENIDGILQIRDAFPES